MFAGNFVQQAAGHCGIHNIDCIGCLKIVLVDQHYAMSSLLENLVDVLKGLARTDLTGFMPPN